jgi:transposase
LLYFHHHASQIEIADLFGVSVRGIKRACKRYKTTGAGSYYKSNTPQRRGPTIFTDDVIEFVEESFEEGLSRKEIAQKYNIKIDTLNRAIRDGRIDEKKKELNRSNVIQRQK